MALSERFEEIKFSKSVAGYSTKEVDGFIADTLLLIRDEEQLLSALKVKLEAFEAQRDEIKKKENEAYRLLEAAKREAEIIVATAKKNAEDIVAKANLDGEVEVRTASARAEEIVKNAEEKAAEKVAAANENAERIILAADENGRKMLADSAKAYEEEMQKAKALSNECADFEKRFRSIVTDTVMALAKIKEETPVPYDTETKVKEEVKAEEPKAEEEPVAKEETETEVVLAGSIPVAALKKEERQPRRLYETVSVEYEAEDDFSSIREIMNGNEAKSPTHFSE